MNDVPPAWSQPRSPHVVDLRCQQPSGLLGVDSTPIRLSWRIEVVGTDPQEAYEVQTSTTPEFTEILASSGTVFSGDQIGVAAPGGPLKSREVRHYRARIQVAGHWGEWCDPLQVEAGLLEARDWLAKGITIDGDTGAGWQSPSPMLRHEFNLESESVRARMHITSLGVHVASINGKPVSDELLSPGWTSYRKRLLSATHDVTALLRRGPNVISAVLGDGWYRGRLGWEPGDDRCKYGAEVALIAQLEVELQDGRTVTVCTDDGWQAATGEIVTADLYDGSTVDLRLAKTGWEQPGYDASAWSRAKVVRFDNSTIRPRMTAPVRVVGRWHADEIDVIDDERIFDGKQNIAGFVNLAVEASAGETVEVRHAEVLESDGTLHTSSLRSARATDTYALDANRGVAHLEPPFTFHGFRYAGIKSDADIKSVEFVAISSDIARRSTFECSLPLLNQLHENVVWSQRDNFVSVPTDCPQRDERLGWTGDAQAFAPTSCTLFDSEAFWANWLEDLAADQHPSLGVSTVVPDVVLDGEFRFGRAGWGDAATMVPWAVYESFGDAAILQRQFDSMTAWVTSLASRRGSDGLIEPGFQFGDWLDPDAPPARPWEAKADSQFLANAFFAHSAKLTAEGGEVIGAPSDRVRELAELSSEIARLTWDRWRDHIIETQTGCAIALRFDLVPDSERTAVADALGDMVRDAEGRISTGFLGTPHVLHALAEGGRLDDAYLMLLRQKHPSWLYQVRSGATTVWERWDAIRSDGSIHPGTMDPPDGADDAEGGLMLSFNHYAYGAVVDWMYRYLAGIAPDRRRPGYRDVILAPKPVRGVDWVEASVDSGYGTIASRWEIQPSGDLTVDITIPGGVTGHFVAPVGPTSVVTINQETVKSSSDLTPGSHRILVTNPVLSLAAQADVDV